MNKKIIDRWKPCPYWKACCKLMIEYGSNKWVSKKFFSNIGERSNSNWIPFLGSWATSRRSIKKGHLAHYSQKNNCKHHLDHTMRRINSNNSNTCNDDGCSREDMIMLNEHQTMTPLPSWLKPMDVFILVLIHFLPLMHKPSSHIITDLNPFDGCFLL
jgi:hypothetical protein